VAAGQIGLEESGVSSGQAVLGVELALPGQLLQQPGSPPSQQQAIPATKRTYAEVAAAASSLDVVDFVYVRRGGSGGPLADMYDGPFRVLSRGPKVFRLQLGQREDNVSRDRLKPHLGTSFLAVAEMRPRGRPPEAGGGSTPQAPPSE